MTNRTAGSAYSFFMGGSSSGKNVNERSAMQMTAVYACVRILSEAIAGLPLHLYRYAEDGSKTKATAHTLYSLLHDEPNPEMTSFVFRETLMTHLLLWGNAYAQIIRNGKGSVIALYPLMPNKMEVDRDENGQIIYKYSRSKDEVNVKEEGTVVLDSSDVLHIPGLGFDGLVGYSPIAMAKNAIGISIACEEFGAKFFANGASPSGVLEHPGILKDPAKVRDSWNAAYGGSANSHKVAVLEEGMKFLSNPYRKKCCHPLYGKVFCAGCGRPYCRRITRAHNGSKDVTWVCIDRFKGSKGEGCRNPIVKERNIMKAISEKIGSDNLDLVRRIEIGVDYSIRLVL